MQIEKVLQINYRGFWIDATSEEYSNHSDDQRRVIYVPIGEHSERNIDALISDAMRYRWLRGDLQQCRRYDHWPYIVDPDKSRLYAVQELKNNELDKKVDSCMIEDMSQFIYTEKLAWGDARFSDSEFRFSDEFSEECEKEAESVLELMKLILSGSDSSRPLEIVK